MQNLGVEKFQNRLYMIAGREVKLRAATIVSTDPPDNGFARTRPDRWPASLAFALIRLTVRSMDVSKIPSSAGKWLQMKWRPA